MRVSIVSVFKSVCVLVALAGLAVGGYLLHSYLPKMLEEATSGRKIAPVPAGEEVIVSVPKGASLSQVAASLHEKGIISNRLVFKIVALIRGEQGKIKAGDYALKTGSDAGEVLDLLISGKTLMFSITVPEGYNIFQIADLFDKRGIMERQRFLDMARNPGLLKDLGVEGSSLEGYLFPDTYLFRPSEKQSGEKIVRAMVKRFWEVYDQDVRPTADRYGWTPFQVVTLASLIEKETRVAEHGLVSAVFHNRLKKNMRLQSDPTVIYGIKAMGSRITRADLNRDHPYNTYVHAGLPPGPIANPGKASLVAAVGPEDKPYLYFVARNDGTHYFSTTLREHNNAVNMYQRNQTDLSRNSENGNDKGTSSSN
jgi:UPF0755 protein